MAFIQSTMVPYNNLLSKDNAFSIVDIFNKYGYYTVGMHPEDKTNWSREKIYSYFGFDEQYFLRDNNTFVDDKELTEEQMFRGHVSDKTVYEKIISLYENKSEESPCFIFAVTMQNHGGYNTSDFDYTVKATDNNNSKLNEYLSSIKKSDDDLKTLFDYFSNADEETIIVFYGDHQPSLNDNVYSTYFGLDGDSSTEENMTKYVIPYMMWTNTSFGKNDTEGSFTSLNYLSPRLLDIIGLNKTAYLSLVRQVEKEAPIINAFGWWDNDMNFHSIDTIESFNKIDHSIDDDVSFKRMIIPSIATSIDALTVGVTFSLFNVNLLLAVVIIFVVTFILSILGTKIGQMFGEKYRGKAQFVGGLVLILMGINILL